MTRLQISLQDTGGGRGEGAEPDLGHGRTMVEDRDSSTEDEDSAGYYTVHGGAGDLAPAPSPPVSAGQPADVRAVHGPVEAEGEEDSDDESELEDTFRAVGAVPVVRPVTMADAGADVNIVLTSESEDEEGDRGAGCSQQEEGGGCGNGHDENVGDIE